MWGIMFIWTSVGLLVVGGLLLALGLRGRRVDDHPLCRKCGFDLFGNTAATRCGECGRDLTRPRAIRIGHRQRRGRLVAVGGAMLVPAVLVLGLLALGSTREVNWLSYAPEWWLLGDLRSDVPADRLAAIDELLIRQRDERLSDASLQRAIAEALRLQRDLEVEWDNRYGQLIERALSDDKLSEEDLEQYVLQGFNVRLEVRPDIRQGDPLPATVLSQPRFAGGMSWQVFVEVDEAYLGDHRLPLDKKGGLAVAGSSSAWSLPNLQAPPELTDQFEAGEQELRARLRLLAGPSTGGAGGSIRPPRGPDDFPQVLVSRTLDKRAPVRVRSRDEPPELFTTDPALREALEAAIAVSAVQPALAWMEGQWLIEVRSVEPPVPVEYKLFLRIGEEEWPVQSATGHMLTHTLAGPDGRSRVERIDVRGFADGPPELSGARRVDVILRPDESAALLRTDGKKPWGRDIVIRNVPVLSSVPTGQQAWYSPGDVGAP